MFVWETSDCSLNTGTLALTNSPYITKSVSVLTKGMLKQTKEDEGTTRAINALPPCVINAAINEQAEQAAINLPPPVAVAGVAVTKGASKRRRKDISEWPKHQSRHPQ